MFSTTRKILLAMSLMTISAGSVFAATTTAPVKVHTTKTHKVAQADSAKAPTADGDKKAAKKSKKHAKKEMNKGEGTSGAAPTPAPEAK